MGSSKYASTIVAASIALIIVGGGLTWAWNEPRLLGGPSGENDAVASDPLSEEETSVDKSGTHVNTGRPWRPPEFNNQEGALGWSKDVFKVPDGLRDRVDFWKDIYTKYSTDQGVIHDSEHVKVIYATVDFTDIMADRNLTESAKRRARKRRVDEMKKDIKSRLQRLAKIGELPEGEIPEGLDAQDLKIWKMYSGIPSSKKFIEATGRKRIRFQLGQRDKFIQGIFYSGRYLPEMEKIFREAGLPVELTRLPFVESSFNVKARSRVGASGIWQFMRYTGKKYLRINYASDERNDPIKSTYAAAKFMRINYEMLGKWPLAITAYNHGAAGVRRMVSRYGTDDIAELADERHGRFKFASANFYATFLAALEVEKNAERYFGKVVWDIPVQARDLSIPRRRVNRQLVLEWFDGDKEKAKEWNPHLSRAFWLGHTSLSQKDFVRVPAEKYDVAMADIEKSKVTVSSSNNDFNFYMINQGQTLSEIAAELGVPLASLLEINGIENPRRVRAGQKLLVPSGK